MASLFNLTGQYLALTEMATDDDPAFTDTLEAITGEIALKADDYVYVMADIDAKIDAVDKENKRLTSILKNLKTNKEQMKKRLLESMKAMGKDEITTDYHSIKIKSAGGKRRLVLDLDSDHPELFPKKYQKKIVEVDTDAIRRDLESGIELTCAHLADRAESLQIK